MAGNIKGIIVEIGGDTSGLQKALKKVNSQTSSLSKELRGVNSLLKLDPKNVELLEQKQTLLNKSITTTEDKLKQLKAISAEAAQKGIDKNEEQAENWRNLQREIINTEEKLKKMKVEASNWTKVGKNIEEVGNKITNVGTKVENLGDKTTKIATSSMIALGTAAVASMNAVDDGFDTIATKTGATGDSAKEMQNILREIGSEIPAEFEDIGAAIGEINTRLDFTGDILKDATRDFLKFAKVNGMDVNTSVQLVTRAMGDAGIEAKDYKQLLEMLTVAGQKSGISLESLTTNLAKYGAPMRALGIETKQAIAMFAGWEKAGVNTEIAFSGMKKAISNWGAAGKDSTKEFSKTLDEIRKCPTIAKATTKAIEVFGAKAGPDLADAIKGGRFEFEKYVEALNQAGGTIESTYGEIVDEVDDSQVAIQKCQIALHDFGETIAKSVGPILSDFSGDFQNLMKKFDDMDPKAKKNVLQLALMTAAAGPLIKVLGTTTKIVGSTTKGVGVFSQAMAVATNKTTSTSKSVNKLATGMQSTAGKASMVVGGTAAIIGGLMALDHQINKSTQTSLKNTDAYIQSIADEVNARQTAIDSRKQQLEANVAEIDNISKLKNELTTLVNANGEVKKGYELRANFILTELNNALGTEYTMTGNVIKEYNNLSKTLDEVILKKRAEVILEGNAEAYKEAIKNKNKLYEEYLKTQEEILKKKAEIKKIEEDPYLLEGSRLADLKEAEKQYDELTEKLKMQSNQIKQYNSDIVTYEKNSELMIKGGVENYKKIEQSYTSVGLTSVNVNKSTIDKKLADVQRYVDESKKKYNVDVQNGINANESKYREEVASGNRSIDELAKQLIGMTSTVDALSPNVVNAWVLLAQNSREQYNAAISQLPPDMQNKISQIVGVVQADTSVQEAMKSFSESVLAQTKIDDKFEEAGKDWLRGVSRGVNNKLIRQEALSSMYGFGVEGLKAISEQAWDEHSPSGETEKATINLLKGVPVGVKKEIPNTLREIRKAADNILKTFTTYSLADFNSLSVIPYKISKVADTNKTTKNLVQNITINTNRKIDDSEIKNITQKINYEMGKFF